MTAPAPIAPARVGVAVMAKASAPGRTKTRLVPPLSGVQAAALNTSFLEDIAANLIAAGAASAGAAASLQGYMAFGPQGARPFFEAIMPPGIGLIESWIGPFGDCLLHAATELFGRGHEAACVLNSDSPTLPTALLVELAEVLGRPGDRAVLGPSEDGGYYVLGLKTAHARLFEDIDWSTERVAGQTLDRAREIGLPVHVLPAWYDVDDAASLRRLAGDVSGGPSFDHRLTPFAAPRSRSVLSGILGDPAVRSALGLVEAPRGVRG